MTTAWASETFEFGGDLVRLTGRGIKEAEYFARVANGCDRVLAEKIFKAMRAVMVKLWAERVFAARPVRCTIRKNQAVVVGVPASVTNT
jgi:hypothetical protein